ncbi:MAG: heavy-metal-associated domain-containing protein [Gammaproteobacteria bacterium]|nr:heavy-metal-associated domain-containing protein [Gammaproteobacteria bacterium]
MKQCLAAVIAMIFSCMAEAADMRYELRVDGLACPYCAYGIEKKIKSLNGVDKASFEIKLNEGLVIFEADTPAPISKKSLQTLINDAGFTLRRYQLQPSNPAKE